LNKIKKTKQKDGSVTEILEEGSVGAGSEGTEVTENFVVQKLRRKGKDAEWKIWGTAEETTLERLPKAKKK